MASIKAQPLSVLVLVLALAFPFFVQGTFGTIECENLNKDSCAFAVSSTGKRCVLEKHVRRSGAEEYACATSQIEADKMKNWIETDACIDACGLDRSALGISSDSLLESRFVRKLCSQQCYRGCPNVVDLYFNLAAGEGAYLPKLCEAQGAKARREMAEIKSSGYIAPAPELPEYATGVNFVYAPAPSPF
ncbi:uncharacterized protein LOC105160472 [Sesamum indicum]|uniref:Uncharacterized protein LOC105160472 n=1 Tax=Sesamum indicum TaxID=4182 RepID=A0A6I9SZ78_SESIN|nr:uncharacterized protein LOC105160472 [Sesamum indicum]